MQNWPTSIPIKNTEVWDHRKQLQAYMVSQLPMRYNLEQIKISQDIYPKLLSFSHSVNHYLLSICCVGVSRRWKYKSHRVARFSKLKSCMWSGNSKQSARDHACPEGPYNLVLYAFPKNFSIYEHLRKNVFSQLAAKCTTWGNNTQK